MRHLRMEDAYDRGDLESHGELWPEVAELLRAIAERRWKDGRAAVPAALRSARSVDESAAVVQFAVGAAEAEYDPAARAEAMKLWRDIPGWTKSAYALQIRAIQDGLGHFFNGALRDADVQFRLALRLAREHGYERGAMKSLFHIGLIEAERSRFPEALQTFGDALILAERRRADFYAVRIKDRIAEIEPRKRRAMGGLPGLKKRILAALRSANVPEARRCLAEAELLRRQRGQRRGRESLGIYLALVMIAKGNLRGGERVLRRTEDPVRRLEALTLRQELFGIGEHDLDEMEYLRRSLGIARIVESATADDGIEICGVALNKLKNESVRRFLRAFIESRKAWSKEDIARETWGVAYDPVVHDRKVYNLIQRCKKDTGIPDLFLNEYGSYRLNPRLVDPAA